MEVNSNTPGKVGEGGDLGHCGQNSEGSLGRVEGTQAGYHLFWSLVGCESVRLNPASIGSWLGSIDSHSLVWTISQLSSITLEAVPSQRSHYAGTAGDQEWAAMYIIAVTGRLSLVNIVVHWGLLSGVATHSPHWAHQNKGKAQDVGSPSPVSLEIQLGAN